MSKRNKATVVCIDKHQNNVVKPFQVPLVFLKNLKGFVAGFVILFVFMITIIFYLLVKDNASMSRIEEKVAQSGDLNISEANQKTPFDTRLLKSKFEAIDQKLSKINSYLKKKGVKPLFTNYEDNIKEGITWASLNNLMDYYNLKLNQTSNLLACLPLGIPLSNARITSHFGGRSNPFSGHGAEVHKGVDFKGSHGDEVKSTAAGRVVFAGKQSGYGNVIVVKHSNGYETKYAHLSKILVSKGANIELGQKIGNVGSTGRSTGPHLHYEVLKNGKQINPKSFLNYE